MLQSSGSGAGLSPLVSFYSKLPKGPAPTSAIRGIKARYFDGKNASGAPLVWTILGIFGLGYTIDYQSTCVLSFRANDALTRHFFSALEYVPCPVDPASEY